MLVLLGLRPSVALVSVTRIGRNPHSTSRFALAAVAPVLVVVVLAAAGCQRAQQTATPPSPSASASASVDPSASPSTDPSASPSASAATLKEFTTEGAGPYQLGRTLNQLETNPGVDEVTTNEVCPGNKSGRGTGAWKDIRLSFRADGKLYLVVNRALDIPTPSGAWLGSTLDQLKTIYAGLVTEQLSQGSSKAFLVRTLTGGGILFMLNAMNQVEAMAAADANYLRTMYTSGGDYC